MDTQREPSHYKGAVHRLLKLNVFYPPYRWLMHHPSLREFAGVVPHHCEITLIYLWEVSLWLFVSQPIQLHL